MRVWGVFLLLGPFFLLPMLHASSETSVVHAVPSSSSRRDFSERRSCRRRWRTRRRKRRRQGQIGVHKMRSVPSIEYVQVCWSSGVAGKMEIKEGLRLGVWCRMMMRTVAL